MRQTTAHSGTSHQAGFNVPEVVLTTAVMMIAAAMAGPPMTQYLCRTKLESTAQEISVLLNASRSIAITRGTPTVVYVDAARRQVVGFADVHGATLGDDFDALLTPVGGQPQRTTDYEIGRVTLPSGVYFEEPAGDSGVESVVGFDNPDPLPGGRAILHADSSIEATGAFRVADRRGNYLEILAAPRTSVRFELRKFEGEQWRSRGQSGAAWVWQ